MNNWKKINKTAKKPLKNCGLLKLPSIVTRRIAYYLFIQYQLNSDLYNFVPYAETENLANPAT